MVFVHPDWLQVFFEVHGLSDIVGHNLAFDWWVCNQHLTHPARLNQTLTRLGTDGRLHDTQILDQLIQLATGQYRHTGGEADRVYPANLGVLAEEVGITIDKTDPYRRRYGELLGKTQREIEQAEPGFLTYAAADVVATWAVYQSLRAKALRLMDRAGWRPRYTSTYSIDPRAVDKFGPLTESIQVNASIVLAGMSRRGLRVSGARRDDLDKRYRADLDRAAADMERSAPGVFRRYKKSGEYMLSKKARLPRVVQLTLTGALLDECERLNLPPILRFGKKPGVSTSAKAWRDYAGKGSTLIDSFVSREATAGKLKLLASLNADTVYTRYDLLKLTGRTGASAHKDKLGKQTLPGLNIQQVPKDKDFRACFTPADGRSFVVCDYAYIELRTLAATCKARFGTSTLADTIIRHTDSGGIDPHERTAAEMLGVSEEDWLALPPAERERARQDAKPVNFGYPGGLGVKRFTEYAKATYGKVYSVSEARSFKRAWLAAYPEMHRWLADTLAEALAWNLDCTPRDCRKWVGRSFDFKAVLTGEWQGTRYFADGVWDWLHTQCLRQNKRGELPDETLDAVEAREENCPAVLRLLLPPAVTLTGRIRAGCKYTDSKNTPFQGLASDGAKVALWKLFAAGFDLVLFAHDEIVVECHPAVAEKVKSSVQSHMNLAMQEVMAGLVPSACSGVIAEHWRKS